MPDYEIKCAWCNAVYTFKSDHTLLDLKPNAPVHTAHCKHCGHHTAQVLNNVAH